MTNLQASKVAFTIKLRLTPKSLRDTSFYKLKYLSNSVLNDPIITSYLLSSRNKIGNLALEWENTPPEDAIKISL